MTAESSEGHARGSPAYRRLTIAMLFTGLSTFALLYSVQPLPPLFANEYRLSAAAASLAVSLTTGPLTLAILAVGLISDRIGRRPIMVSAMLAASALTFLARWRRGQAAALDLFAYYMDRACWGC